MGSAGAATASSSSSSSGAAAAVASAAAACTGRGLRLGSSGSVFAAGALLIVLFTVAAWRLSADPGVPAITEHGGTRFYSVDVVREFPHDPQAFTQGLLCGEKGTLFESTGLYGESSVREVELQTGKVVNEYRMDSSLFGEGLTLIGHRLFQVTWRDTTGFIYDQYNLTKWQKFRHQMNDGWGLATDGNVLFGSDGSSTLYQFDQHTFTVLKKVTVRYQGHEIEYLNELEYINGEVWANVWQTNCIARISPEDGTVLGWVLLHKLRQGLLKSGYPNIDVLNGIAWDKPHNRLFVTGKLWPKLFEVTLRPEKGPTSGSIEGLCSIGWR